MPIESAILEHKPAPFDKCPHCGTSPFSQFMRGQVQRFFTFSLSLKWPFIKRRPSCAIICWSCKNIVGWES